jgi:UDP-4-amino-4,6-dideoxy-N-acetyl-beta-L-altrosamine transaminase
VIPYGKQNISTNDIDAVVQVLKSDYLTQGPVVKLFEDGIKEYVGSDYSVAFNSATSALHIACLALELKKGDWLWTSPNSFVASANCGLYCAASVDFVDINLQTYNICEKRLEKKLIEAKQKKMLPKVLIPVHFGGLSCNMKKIHALSKEYGFKIIEDASHAIGGSYLEKPIGNCLYSDITIFSFHPVKIITSGEGGIATTNSIELYEKMHLLRSHGITKDKLNFNNADTGDWHYEQLFLGFNYRLTDIHAAIGLSQLNRLDQFINERRELAINYDEKLSKLPIHFRLQSKDSLSANHLYVIRLKENFNKKTRLSVFNELRKMGIGVNVHYIPIHTQPYFKNLGFKYGDFPESENYYENIITIPLYHGMKPEEQNVVIESLFEVIS